MTISPAFGLAFLAMLSLGVAWFLAARASKALGALHAMFLFQLIGLPFFIFLYPFANFPGDTTAIIQVLLLGFGEAFVMLALFKALEIGSVSIVTPVIASYGLIAFALGALFLNESVTTLKILGAIMVFTGIVLISFKMHKQDLKKKLLLHKGTGLALLAALGTGFYFFFVGILSRNAGWFVTALGIRAALSATSFVFILIQGDSFKKITKNVNWSMLAWGAMLDVIGFSLFTLAVETYEVSNATIIVSAQSLVIVLLSWWFLKEKLMRYQILGVLAVVAGLMMLHLQ